MAEQKKAEDKKDWLPILAGLGLVGGGLLLWYGTKDTQADDSVPDDNGIPDAQQNRLLQILQNKWASIAEYQDRIYANGRTPSDQEFGVLESMHQDAALEEQSIKETYRVEFARAAEDFARNLGYYVVIPGVIGFLFAGAIAYWWRHRRPPTQPPSCPKDGQTFSTPEGFQAHVHQDHSVTTDVNKLIQADAYWQTQPYWVSQSVAVIGQIYGSAYTRMSTWSLPVLRQGVDAMAYTYACEMGTMGSMSAMGQMLALAMI